MAAVAFEDVDIFFGRDIERAARLAREGGTREDILKETGTTLGVTGCSLAVEPGEICVLMGLSGSGKSTLLRAVNGLNPVSAGQVLVDDQGRMVDVASCDPATLRQLRQGRVAMVFQQFGLLPWRTVAENVGLGLELRGVAPAERARIVDQKLELVGLTPWRDKRIDQLSGGMQQRVGLARAFATDADILLMDEPFSALDPLIRHHLQDELLVLQRELRKTILFVSHDLDEAIKIGNHIAIMEGGRIVQYGKPEEIVLAPASRYVADFVAHMNPLQVLRCASLMTPVEQLQEADGQLLLDWSGHNRIALDDAGRPTAVKVEGGQGRLEAYDAGLDLDALDREVIVTGSPELTMRAAIEVRYRTGTPVVIVEGERMVGVVGDHEIYRGMLRQTGASTGEDGPAGAAATRPVAAE
jgi:glycine betaine/proline transport system ATP-binding protein